MEAVARHCRCGAEIIQTARGRPRRWCTTCRPPATPPKPPPVAITDCPLSARQRDVIELLAEGLVYKQIAARMHLGVSTVRTHLHQAYTRLGVFDRAQAVLMCAREGWIAADAAHLGPASREVILLGEVKRLLRQYVADLPNHRPHRITPAARAYLDAFDTYLRRPDRHVEADVVRAFEVMAEEAGLVPSGRNTRRAGPRITPILEAA